MTAPHDRYLSVRIQVRPDRYDRAMGVLLANGMLGCSEEPGDQTVCIEAWFTGDTSPDALHATLSSLCDLVSETSVADRDWNAAWRQTVQPVRIAPTLWASPTWRPPVLGPGEQWVRIEPAMAFGTGHHETTRLSATLIAGFAETRGSGWSMLDIGTGSGILCFAAGLLGADWCLGLEIDPLARMNLTDNCRDNPDAARPAFVIGSTNALAVFAAVDLVVMNMLYQYSAPLLPDAIAALAVEGRLIWSGLLAEAREESLTTASRQGLRLCDEQVDGEWWAGVFSRTAG